MSRRKELVRIKRANEAVKQQHQDDQASVVLQLVPKENKWNVDELNSVLAIRKASMN